MRLQEGGTKLDKFLPKNQHAPRKLLNFENWCSGCVCQKVTKFDFESQFSKSKIVRIVLILYPLPLENSTTRITTVEEGSGNAVYQSLSPTEIGELRTSFYEANEVDLLRLDTTCQDRFISAPQIFHAKIR